MRFLLAFLLLLLQTSFALAEEDCYYLRAIEITGKHKTRESVILRELNVKTGDCIYPEQLNGLAETNRLRLMNLMIFNWVTIEWAFPAADSILMMIEVTDRFPVFPELDVEFADRNINVWLNEQQHDLKRINIGLTLANNNFRGNRELLKVGAQIGYTQKAELSYHIPFVDKEKKHGIGFSLAALQNREIAYRTKNNKLLFFRDDKDFMLRREAVSLWYTYRPAYAIIHKLQLNYLHYGIHDKIVNLNPEYLGGGSRREHILNLQYRFEYNGVDNWNYPLKGNRLIGTFDQYLAVADKTSQSTFKIQYDHYFRLSKHYFASLVIRTKASFPGQKAYIFQQNLGYDFDYIRGFEYYVIDGSAFALMRLNFKRTIMDRRIYLPVRYFEVIPLRIYAKVFGDAGTSYQKNHYSDALNSRLLYAAGVGIDIVTLYDIKLRIEYTVNSLAEKGLFLHKSGE